VPAESADVQPIRIGEVVRSSIWIILATSVLGLLLGLAVGSRIDQQSVATAKILLVPLEGNPFYPSSRGEELVNLETEAQALRSTAVAELAREQLGSDLTEQELLAQVDVSVPVNTQTLEITFSAGSDEVATDGAQAFAESYLEHRSANARELFDRQIAELDDQIDAGNRELLARATELSGLDPDSPRALVLSEEIRTISSQISSLNASRTDLSTRQTNAGDLVTPATLQPSGPITPSLLLPLFGLFAGAGLGLLIGLLRSRSDDRIREPGDALDLGVAVLGTVAWNDPVGPGGPGDRVAANEDEYRKLRVAVLALERRRPFTVLVASASSASGSPLTVVDLSTSFARAGLDTVVIDATSHGVGPATILDPGNEVGLAEVLLGQAPLTEALSPVAPLLWVLPPGQGIGEVADLFVGRDMSRMLDATKDHCDVVIVAADSVQQGVAQSLADMADAAVVETDQDLTTRSELARASRALSLLSCSFLGTFFLGRDALQRTQVFRPHLAVNQRQLPPGPFAVLSPAEGGHATGTDEGPVDPGDPGADAGRQPAADRSGRAEDPAAGGT
jgi:polysaccharide biosynthesis transport protein